MVQEGARARVHAGGDREAREDGLGQADGGVQEAPRGAGGRHDGGNRWIGSGGTSPFGHGGVQPEGIRVGGPSKGATVRGQGLGEARLPGLRRHASKSARATSRSRCGGCAASRAKAPSSNSTWTTRSSRTAKNAGWLDLKMVPERHNTVKVLMLLDVGGTMDEHIKRTEELFSAAKSEFKHLEFYYFHNCVYDFLWRNNRRRYTREVRDLGRDPQVPHDWKLIFVGDATMSPYEILQPGGSVEYNNEEAGAEWLQRFFSTLPEVGLAQPRAGRALAVPPVDFGHPPAGRRQDVPDDTRRPDPRDAAAVEVAHWAGTIPDRITAPRRHARWWNRLGQDGPARRAAKARHRPIQVAETLAAFFEFKRPCDPIARIP